MRWMADALRGAWAALAAHPGMFASVTLAVAALNVVAPVAILSAVRKPLDFYTFNPWLKRLPEYIASDDAPLVEKLAKLADLALFWVSAGSTYGGAEWGFAVDVTDVGRTLLVSALFGLYFALWRCYRDLALGGAARALRRGGLAGAAATVFGVSTGACSVTGCGAPVIPVLGLAFVGLESGTLHFLAGSSRVATIALLVVLVLAVGYLGRSTCAVRENGRK
ncbi:MAG: hypothetical protein E6H39_12105 [Betaproteobacteria bacterium]|nr:MAG: hypothetical protein E6H39_12105 [Betaproteobacteria bacterium]